MRIEWVSEWVSEWSSAIRVPPKAHGYESTKTDERLSSLAIRWVWVYSDTNLNCDRKPSSTEFISKYFHFYLLSYRVDKTRFSSSRAASDCYVHLHASPTFQLVFNKFFNVWYAIFFYIIWDIIVVRTVLRCHVVHDEERKIWTGKFVAAAELESVRVEMIWLPWCYSLPDADVFRGAR